jgi:hypothetical protein
VAVSFRALGKFVAASAVLAVGGTSTIVQAPAGSFLAEAGEHCIDSALVLLPDAKSKHFLHSFETQPGTTQLCFVG